LDDTMSRIVVCGSINMDVVCESARRPRTGETLLGAKVSFLPGGKGLNQAVAAARLGTPTAMMGAVGHDAFGTTLRDFLADCGVDTSGVRTLKGRATGLALIQLAEGDNAITVASGANHLFTRALVRRRARRGEVWVAQLETPVETTQALMTEARQRGAQTILNMAPFIPHPARMLKSIDIAVLNEIELAAATGGAIRATSGRSAIAEACDQLRRQGPRTVIATLGPRGAVVVTREGPTSIPAFAAKVVDTTGAGDCFVGALAVKLAAGAPPAEAARFACAAAACSIEKLGAAPSMPSPKDVAARLAQA
jgi:ribokinase